MQSNTNTISVEEIQLEGFKNQTTTTGLAKLNLIVGDNGSGKSAIPLALMFAATGATPDGRKIDTVYEYADTDGCAVGLKLSDGFGFTRKVIANHRDAKLSQIIDITGRRDALSVSAAEAAIEAKLGCLPSMWNASEFLGLSPKAKRNELLRMFAGTSSDLPVDPEAVMARLVAEFVRLHPRGGDGAADNITAALANMPVADQLNLALAKATDIVRDERESTMLADRVRLLRAGIKGDIAEAVAAMVEATKKVANETEADHRSVRQALSELSARKASLTDVAEDCRVLQDRDAAYEGDEREVIRLIGNAEGRAKAEAAIRERIGTLERRIADSRNSLRAAQEAKVSTPDEIAERVTEWERLGCAIDIAKLRAESDQLSGALSLAAENPNDPDALEAEAIALEAKLPTVDDGPRQQAAAEVERLTGEEAAAGRRVNATIQAATQAKADRDAEAKRLEQAKASPWAEARRLLTEAVSAINTVDAANALTPLANHIVAQLGGENITALESRLQQLQEHLVACDDETANARRDHIRLTNERLAAENTARIERDKATVAQAERTQALQFIASIRDRATIARNAGGEADKRRTEARERLTQIEVEIADLKAKHAAMPVIVDIKAGESQWSTLGDAINDERLAVTQRDRNIAGITETIEADTTSLAQAKSELETLAPAGDMEALTAKRNSISTARAELKRQIDARTEFESAERTYAETETRAKAKGLEHEVCKTLHAAVGKLRDAMMKQLAKPVTDRMNRFLAYCAPDGAEAYCDIESAIGRETCELGWVRNGRKVTIRAMSGGERTIFTAALQFALVTLADPPYKLLWIEADQCDTGCLIRLTDACEAVADSLSQVVVTTHTTRPTSGYSAWNIIVANRAPRVPEPALPVREQLPAGAVAATELAGMA